MPRMNRNVFTECDVAHSFETWEMLKTDGGQARQMFRTGRRAGLETDALLRAAGRGCDAPRRTDAPEPSEGRQHETDCEREPRCERSTRQRQRTRSNRRPHR